MNTVEIWTDGACSKRVGGWAYILKMGPHEKTNSGAVDDTTNNRMEMTAAIKALEALKKPCKVKLYSDSELLCNAFNQNWIMGWQNNDWQTKDGGDVKNRDLWEALAALEDVHDVEWVWVKGHDGNEENERCDEMAVQARLAFKGEQITLKDKLHNAIGALKQARTRAHAAFKLIEELKDKTNNIDFELFKNSKRDLAKLIKQAETQLVEELEQKPMESK